MAPLTSNKADGLVTQTVGVLEVKVNVNAPDIAILAVAEPVQVPVEPITVYVVAADGVAVTLAPLAELKVAEGLHV